MFARLKSLPGLTKIVTGCLGVLLVCATVYLLQSHRKQHREPICCGLSPEYLERLEKREKLEKDKTEYAQLLYAVRLCQGQMEEALSKQAKQNYHQPECVATMRQVTTRGAQLEAEMQQLQSSLETDGQQSSQPANGTNVEAQPR
jgi:hypothetical protein